jgi:hypothetical protein
MSIAKGLFLIAVAGVSIVTLADFLVGPTQSDVSQPAETPAPAQTSPAASQAPPPQQAAPDKSWNTTYQGHFLRCGIASGATFFIVMPNQEEMQVGIGPKVNQAPSNDEWSTMCLPAAP